MNPSPKARNEESLLVDSEALAEPAPSAVDALPIETPIPQATFHFPSDFTWGVATSAHQVEGGNTHSNWWAWEQEEGRIKEGHTSGRACDWWESAETDFDRAAEMGLNGLRLSIEWSRVEPRPGEFDGSALARYGEMVQGLRERGIEPMVTLHHFTDPQWLAEQGGWENRETIGLFARFARRVVEALGQHCDLWCTVNLLEQRFFIRAFEPGMSLLAPSTSRTFSSDKEVPDVRVIESVKECVHSVVRCSRVRP